MKKIAVLGPKGTYSDIAAKKYLKDNNLDLEIVYYPSILKTSLAVDEDTIAILPFENTLDGFVIESLDTIIANNYKISDQIKLNIDFAFVSNAKSIDEVKNCYCQFKAHGQCIDFIANNNFNIITTQSNGESVNKVNNSDNTYGAIVPIHALEENSYNLVIPHIADRAANETRFFVIGIDNYNNAKGEEVDASVVVTALEDRPGLLFDILKEFHIFDINLKSIMSRPTKTEMGRYNFYLECNLYNENVYKLLKVIEMLERHNHYKVNILGIYDII